MRAVGCPADFEGTTQRTTEYGLSVSIHIEDGNYRIAGNFRKVKFSEGSVHFPLLYGYFSSITEECNHVSRARMRRD